MSLLFPPAAAGQLVGGPVVPSGYLALEIDSNFITWDERFGLRAEAGSPIDVVEPLGWNLSSDALGSDRLPGAAATEARLRMLLDDPGYRINLGSTTHLLAAHVRRVPLGFRLGVFPWLTVGASLPMVQRRFDSELIYAPGEANAGVAPSQTASALFLAQYLTSLTTARVAVDRRCERDGETPRCLADRAVLRKGDALLGTLSSLFGEAVYFPLEDSGAGQALVVRMDEVRSGLSEMGVGFTAQLPLGTPLDRAGFDSLVVAPAFGGNGLPLKGMDSLWEPGDLEVGAAIRVLNLVPRAEEALDPGQPADSAEIARPDSRGGFGFRLGVAGTVRLPTGVPQDTIRDFLDMDVTEGQMDVEARVFGSIDWARRVGLAFDARYGIPFPVSVRRRIHPPDAGFAPLPQLETVRWRPGRHLEYAILPQLLLTPELAIGFVYRSWSRGADTFEGDAGDLAPLSLETEASARSLGVDVRYSSFAGGGFPVEVRFGWEAARDGSGGRTPKTGRVRFGASLFRRVWGGG